jgi:hypothetical protein
MEPRGPGRETTRTEGGRDRGRWLLPESYPTIVLLCALGLTASLFAWLSVGLLSVAMANFSFLERHGLRAVTEGGLLQLAGIALKSVTALFLYLLFRGIETELLARWTRRRDT